MKQVDEKPVASPSDHHLTKKINPDAPMEIDSTQEGNSVVDNNSEESTRVREETATVMTMMAPDGLKSGEDSSAKKNKSSSGESQIPMKKGEAKSFRMFNHEKLISPIRVLMVNVEDDDMELTNKSGKPIYQKEIPYVVLVDVFWSNLKIASYRTTAKRDYQDGTKIFRLGGKDTLATAGVMVRSMVKKYSDNHAKNPDDHLDTDFGLFEIINSLITENKPVPLDDGVRAKFKMSLLSSSSSSKKKRSPKKKPSEAKPSEAESSQHKRKSGMNGSVSHKKNKAQDGADVDGNTEEEDQEDRDRLASKRKSADITPGKKLVVDIPKSWIGTGSGSRSQQEIREQILVQEAKNLLNILSYQVGSMDKKRRTELVRNCRKASIFHLQNQKDE